MNQPVFRRSRGAVRGAALAAALGLALVGLALLGAMPVDAAPKAKVSPPEIDLGQIDEGNSYERFLELTNVGDGTLVLEDLKTSCGCTAAATDGAVELDAGQSQKIRITFNSKNMEGDIHKKVTVVTNDPENKHYDVLLKANVHKALRWEPKYVMLERQEQKASFEQIVSIQGDFDLGLEVKDTFVLGGRLRDKPSELFDVERVGQRKADGRDVVDLQVKMRPGAKPQKLSEILVVVTNQPATNDTLRIPIRGEIQGRIRVYPQFAVLPIVNPGEESVKDVSLTASEGTFQVLSAKVDDSPLAVEVIPQNEGRQAVIRLRYTGEEGGNNGVRTLHIETDDEHQNVIELPVRYHTRKQT